MTQSYPSMVAYATICSGDTMTHPIQRDDPRLAAWSTFLRAHARVVRELERELQSEQELALTDYDVLVQLAGAPDRRLRMSDLADRLVLSRSGVTRLVDRLLADGLVDRVVCEDDRRGQWAALTDTGLARLRRASTTHLRGVATHFLDRLSVDDLAELERMLDGVATG
jgi:DNA-binding MarR family transcriptional regulator